MGSDGEEQDVDDALHLKSLSETSYKSGDIPSALRYAHRALRISPSLPGIQPLLSSLRILSHYPREDSSLPDYYGILQLDPFSELDAVRRQYKTLALALHPDKNPSFVCQDAFKVVADALRVLSDSEEKERYDLRLRVRMQEEGLGQAGSGSGGEGKFWSRCRECGKLHEFEKGYSGKRLVCSGCGKSFKAVGVGEEVVGDGSETESEATDEDAGMVAATEDSKKVVGVDGAIGGRDVIYVRRRKGIDGKVGETDATQKPSKDAGGGFGSDMEVREMDVDRRGRDTSIVYGEGPDREFEMGDEEEGFWDLTLKDGLSKEKIAEASGGSMSKSKVNVGVDKLMNDGEKHKVQSRDVRKEMKSGKKRVLRDVEEKKPVVVIGLRCIADDGKFKISESSAKLHSKKHQSPEVGGRCEWGWSRQRSQRVQVESVEESTQKSDGEEDVSGEEVMTLAEMRSRLNQKLSSGKGKPKKKNKENKKQKVGEKRVGVDDENDHERVMEQVMNDKEEDQHNNDRDVNDENEHEDGVEERANMGVLEESGGRGDVEMDTMNAGRDEVDRQDDLVNEKDQEECMVILVNNMSGKGKGNGDQEADTTGILPPSRDGSLENGTQVNGDVVEETAADTKWTKRIRCYESKRHALSKRDKDSGVKILGTPGTPNRRLSLVRERPISTKSRIPRHLVSSDSEFYDFDVARGERKFKKGQVWAIYDEFRRPKRYGLIDEVLSTNPFAVRLKWLAKQETKGQDPSTSCAGCGRFKVTTFAVVKSVGMFSHEVDGERVAREMYDIYPKKGSVWAIYGGRQSLELKDVVICLTSYTEMFGVSLGYLEEIEGIRTVYKRKDIGWDAVRWLGKDEISLLSHQIPARKLLHEVVSDFKEDCWVLDPASLSLILPA